MAEVMTIKTTLELFIGMGWLVKVPLVIEFSSHVALEWLLERNYRSWTLRNLFIGIDHGVNQLVRVQFAFIHRQCNGMADALAKASVRRPSFAGC